MSTGVLILEYLKKQGQTNTFRLASELGIDRHKILKIIGKLEKKHLIEFKSGTVKFPEKDKKAAKIVAVKMAPSKQERKIVHKIKKATHRNIKLKVIENLQAENKMFKEKLLGLETRIKSQSYYKNKVRNQNVQIEQLERKIKVLQQKVKSPKIIGKVIIKKVPIKMEEATTEQGNEEIKSKKFKLPKLNINWIKNIQQLHVPEVLRRSI